MKKFTFIAVFLTACPVWADMMTTGISGPSTVAAGYVGPGDINAFNVWGGLCVFSRADCTGSVAAIRLRRTSGGESDINITTSCDLDISTASTFCTAGADPCFVTTVYNRGSTGATHNLVQAAAAQQPAFIFNCNGTRPCMQSTASTIFLAATNNFTPATGVMSMVVTANRSTGTGASGLLVTIVTTGNRLNAQAANTWRISGAASGTIDRAAADAVWHTGIAVITGTAASSLRVDDATTAGTVTGNTTAGLIRFVNATAATTARVVEGGIIDNVALTAAQQQTMVANTRSYGYIP